MWERAVKIRETALGKYDPRTIETVVSYTHTLFRLERFSECEVLYRYILLASERIYGASSHKAGQACHYLANTLAELNRYDDANAYYAKALSILEALGTDDKEIATLLRDYAGNMEAAGHIEQAAALRGRQMMLSGPRNAGQAAESMETAPS